MALLRARYKTAVIVAQIDRALETGEPYVLNRAADGEAAFITIAAGGSVTGHTKESLWDWYRISLDNSAAVKAIVGGITRCDALGVPTLEAWAGMWNMALGLVTAFRYWGHELSEMPLTHHAVAQYMIMRGEFERWHGRRMVVVNENASELAQRLVPIMNIVGAVDVGPDEIDGAVDRAAGYDFEIALLGVGVRKFAIAHRLAERTGRVVLDLGWTLNILSNIYPDHSTGRDKEEMTGAKGYVLRDWHEAARILREQPGDV